ncbi:MAG: sugar ABC transporter substrate-binding protein [Treponema sp.]|jgi:multiple sugar transport system substrate-binding protein|nr:sugar ABC transporter substrate-binding protein [Treponema sp.]
MKKIVVVLTALALVTLLPSCGKPQGSGKAVEVQFFHTTWVPGMLEILDEAIVEFEAANPGIKIVQTRTSWTDFPSQLMTSLMGGVAPDLVMANPPILAQFRGIGAFADLTDRISPEFTKTLLPSAVQVMTVPGGGFDGMPQEGCNWALFYRKDLFEQAGLDPNKPPANWEELVAYGKKLTRDTNGDGKIDQYGYGWPVAAENANDYWVNFMQQAGAEITGFENGKWVSKLDKNEALQGTQFMYDLVQTHKIAPVNIVEYDWEGVTNAFVSGEVAMMHNGAWVVGSVKQKGPELDGKWGTAVLFSGPAGPAYRGHPNTFHIMKASQHKDEAWKFLEFFYNTPSKRDPGLTLAGSYCNASGGMLYTTDFINYARGTYEPLLQPFLDASDACVIPPMDPQWMTLNNMFTQSKIQQLLMGQVSVRDALKDLHENLEKLHQAK